MSSLKKPKMEKEECMAMDDENGGAQLLCGTSREDQEEPLVYQIEERSKEVEQLCKQLDEAKQRLKESQIQLAILRSQSEQTHLSRKTARDFPKNLKVEKRTQSPIIISEESSCPPLQPHPEPILFYPAPKFKKLQSSKASEHQYKALSISGSRSTVLSTHVDSTAKVKKEKTNGFCGEQKPAQSPKRKFEQKEDVYLLPHICMSPSPQTLSCQPCLLIPSQHNRRLRSLVLCPADDKVFATSALDGTVNLWEIQGKGLSANLLSSSDCTSLKRRWPEDVTWHPQRKSLFSVYTADEGDSQISILDLNKKTERKPVRFLEDKPHAKGVINNIVFTPWEDTCFVTGGSDHAVFLWTEKTENNSWKPKLLHKSLHSSSVMGVTGVHHKKIVMSAGADKRIIGFDLQAEMADYKFHTESKCMRILPNPCDFNLFMVQTGTPERQLRLFDLRIEDEIHSFGWKQENSETQSALVSQAWSPDGLYLTSGSADPLIHIFDIRYNGNTPFLSVHAHHKRVLRVAWHNTLPLLISISSDLNIGLYKIS